METPLREARSPEICFRAIYLMTKHGSAQGQAHFLRWDPFFLHSELSQISWQQLIHGNSAFERQKNASRIALN